MPALGMHVIIPSSIVQGREPADKDSLKTLSNQNLTSLYKTHLLNPSGPGALLSLLFLIAYSVFSIVILLSRAICWSLLKVGISEK